MVSSRADEAAPRPLTRPSFKASDWTAHGLQALAGLLGACGVAVAAASAHRGGGALGETAATFMLLHAVAVLCMTFHWLGSALRGIEWLVTAGVMLVGCVLFSGDLALAALANVRPWPPAAPIGGTLMLAGWVLIVISAGVSAARRRAAIRT